MPDFGGNQLRLNYISAETAATFSTLQVNHGRGREVRPPFAFPKFPFNDSRLLFRKRKLTDKSIPPSLLRDPDFVSESRMYQDLLEMERKLDWTMTRKKLEVQDALSRNPSVSHFLSSQFCPLEANAIRRSLLGRPQEHSGCSSATPSLGSRGRQVRAVQKL
jgi:hypothetical protein